VIFYNLSIGQALPRLFFSHSSLNYDWALALQAWLIREGWSGEEDIFLDPERSIAVGQRWARALEDAATRFEAARIWDAASGKEIAVLRSHEGHVTSAAFSPDGSRIVTAGDGAVPLETMPVKSLLAEACARLAGVTKLTREEIRLAGYPDSMPEIDVCQEQTGARRRWTHETDLSIAPFVMKSD
jgi:hypothetical protein